MPKYKYRYTEKYKGTRIDVRANTQSELLEKVQAKKEALDMSVLTPDINLVPFGRMYFETYKKNTVTPQWYKAIIGYFNGVIVKYLGNVPVTKIKPLDVQRMLNTATGRSYSYRKKLYDITCQLWLHAYRNGLTKKDYSLQFEMPRGKEDQIGRSLTDEERVALLKVLDGHRGEIFCKLMLYCGLRPSEIRALQWSDIDLDTMTIAVIKARDRANDIGYGKTDASHRVVPIPDHMRTLLLSHQGKPDDYVTPPSDKWRMRMWDNVKRLMDIEMGAEMYRNAIIESKLSEPFKMYYLRHTYCTDLEKKRVPINIASRMMGHANIAVTAKIYTHASGEALEIARDLINQ